jgi:hypothetical protein
LKKDQAKTVPSFIKQIAGLSEENTFGDGFEFLIQWFWAFTNYVGPCKIDKDSIDFVVDILFFIGLCLKLAVFVNCELIYYFSICFVSLH